MSYISQQILTLEFSTFQEVLEEASNKHQFFQACSNLL